MKACGLIVEYNPFHNGHLHHLNQSRLLSNAECMIAVMSGNFLQRGEPAIVDKWARSKMALSQGVDLVIELPYPYAVQHSEYFSQGAVTILNKLHADYLCFGSEHGDIEEFIRMEKWIHSNEETYKQVLKKHLNDGLSYPMAHEKAHKDIGPKGETLDLTKPNNILGRQYVRQILEQNTSMMPLTIPRIHNNYHDNEINGPIASATSIRNELIRNNNWNDSMKASVPSSTEQIMNDYYEETKTWHLWELYFPLLINRILTSNRKDLQAIHGIKEGLENRIYQAAEKADSYTDFIQRVKTKRYTWTSIQRIFTHILTNTTKDEMLQLRKQEPEVRILGMNQTGRAYLHYLKSKELEFTLYTSSKSPYRYQDHVRRINHAYYSILSTNIRRQKSLQEFQSPIIYT
ncbi:putative nucleotidyltransferase [Gracilibacillus halotolerans]|uniref:tRNA(Met) cytidine acetate ligase n=1 Tax=Gracilibacillus halotolerans TaxID=74386 RepID=A0A841RFI1_9BACI|nr:nucleotidyltransferase [Gracilibacillus halotolerans]MBB6511341.1 putative nucleotidyltransferase [Gracilibacillus halotolerans]